MLESCFPVAGPETLQEKPRSICHRCLQPVPARAGQCPHCRTRLERTWFVPYLLAFGGLLALVFVIALMVTVIHDNDIENAPPQGNGQEQPALGTPPSLDK